MRRLLAALVSIVVISAQHVSAEPVGTGMLTGQFLNPTPSCPPATCSGAGTSSMFWGDPEPNLPPNNLSFTGRGFSAALGQPFVLGLLQFQNSSTTNNIDRVDLRLQSTALNGDPTFTQTAQLNLTIVQTINVGDPVADADYVYFTNFPQFGSFRVFEGQTSTVELIGAFHSLDVLGFGQSFNLGFSGFGQVGNPSVAFTNPSIVPSLNPSTVPEPASVILFASGLI